VDPLEAAVGEVTDRPFSVDDFDAYRAVHPKNFDEMIEAAKRSNFEVLTGSYGGVRAILCRRVMLVEDVRIPPE